MSDLITTTFALDDPAPVPAEIVRRRGKIFEAGTWPEKDFSLTPEELAAAVAAFRPVPLDLEHTPTVLDGKLGTLEALELADDGRALIGTVALPRWLDTVLAETPRKVSCTWHKDTKQLHGLALVTRPHIADAAVFAAFAGARHSAADLADMQAIHDLTTKQGAACDRRNLHFTAPQETKPMSLKAQLLALFGQLPDDDPVLDATPAPVATPTPAPAPDPDPAVTAEFARVAAERDAARAELETTRAQERQTKAAAWADTQIRAGKAYPAERATLTACYAQALADDAAAAVTVTFGTDGSQHGSRADALTALFAARPATPQLTQETIPAGTALFAVGAPPAADPSAEQQATLDRLLGLTTLGQAVRQERK